MVGSPLYSIAFRKLIKISGCSEEANIFLNAKSVLGLMKRIYFIGFFLFTAEGAEDTEEEKREEVGY